MKHPNTRFSRHAIAIFVSIFVGLLQTNEIHSQMAAEQDVAAVETEAVRYRNAEVEGLTIAFREAGPVDAPTIVLLHGFPTSSHMFRNLIPALADRYHVIAPDYPGFGNSSMPSVDEFDYTFAHLTDIVEALLEQLGVDHFSLYVMDYGAPIGFRLAMRNQDKVDAFIVQNGNAYEEGLRDFWVPIKAYWADKTAENADALRGLFDIDATMWQYLNGTRNPEAISPDNWNIDQRLLDRPGNNEIQLALFYDYRTNVDHYPAWQEYFRAVQPPMLIIWGKNDYIFPAEGAYPYQADLENLEFHLLDTGHFALEEDGEVMAGYIRNFLQRNIGPR